MTDYSSEICTLQNARVDMQAVKAIDIKLPVYFENDMVGIDRIMNDEYPGDEAIKEAFGSYGKARAYIEPIVRKEES